LRRSLLIRVTSANLLYAFVARIIEICDAKGIFWSVENPRNSHFWSTSWMTALISSLKAKNAKLLETSFQNCAYGGDRPKWSKFLHNVDAFLQLEATCNGQHKHKSWGVHTPKQGGAVFATAEEAAYPLGLCVRMAELIALSLPSARHEKFENLAPPAAPVSNQGPALPLRGGVAAAEAGRQARRGAPRLIPEYKGSMRFVMTAASCDHFLDGMVLKKPVQAKNGIIPKHSRILRTQQIAGDGGLERAVFVALPWDKYEFLQAAEEVAHPIDGSFGLEPEVYENIFWVLTAGPTEVIRFREAVLDEYRALLADASFASAEARIHSLLPEEFKRVLEAKSFLLHKHMLTKINHVDEKLLGRLTAGFQLFGELEDPGVFQEVVPKNTKPSTRAELHSSSRWSKLVAEESVRPSGDHELDAALQAMTDDDVASGFLVGPFTSEELDRRHGPLWIPARRFAIRQGGRFRAIDDFSVFGQNATVVSGRRVTMGSVDAIIAMAKLMGSAVREDRTVSITSPSGFVFEGILHPEWTLEEARKVVGRCIDLKSAYKQLVRCRTDASLAIVAHWSMELQKVVYYEAVALPFGAAAAVPAFNRASFALKLGLIKELRLAVTCFFDDFPLLEFDRLAASSGDAMLEFFRLLGWKVSLDKLVSPSAVWQALGVEFNFVLMSQISPLACIIIGNTARRREAIAETIDSILLKDAISALEVASLKGRLAFSESQHWSRVGCLATRALASVCVAGAPPGLPVEVREALKIVRWLILHAPPRKLHLSEDRRCNIIFVDGAVEDECRNVTVGGVLFSPHCKRPEFFGMKLDAALVDHWRAAGSQQVIGQAELLPVLIAKIVWRKILSNSRNLWFIDNEAARQGLIRSYSPVRTSSELIFSCKVQDMKAESSDWYARVPTCANWADGPSRIDFSDMAELGARQIFPVVPSVEDLLLQNVCLQLSNDRSSDVKKIGV
jgi:hypothetical protein